jgi:glycosyltransferase involved in cell wall biosynthesis
MSDLIRSLSRRVDLVQLEYTQMAEYREDTGAVPVILVEHDITFTLYSQLADFNPEPQARSEYGRWLDFERIALQCSNQVWTMSDEERSIALAHGASRHRTKVIPNGVDLRRFTPAPKPAGAPVVLFVGSFRHLPNLLAFELLRSSIMPSVWRECPDAVLHVIAGPYHERAAELAGKTALLTSHPRIVIEGFVEDVRPRLSRGRRSRRPAPGLSGDQYQIAGGDGLRARHPQHPRRLPRPRSYQRIGTHRCRFRFVFLGRTRQPAGRRRPPDETCARGPQYCGTSLRVGPNRRRCVRFLRQTDGRQPSKLSAACNSLRV